jgi:hypothetical protein
MILITHQSTLLCAGIPIAVEPDLFFLPLTHIQVWHPILVRAPISPCTGSSRIPPAITRAAPIAGAAVTAVATAGGGIPTNIGNPNAGCIVGTPTAFRTRGALPTTVASPASAVVVAVVPASAVPPVIPSLTPPTVARLVRASLEVANAARSVVAAFLANSDTLYRISGMRKK